MNASLDDEMAGAEATPKRWPYQSEIPGKLLQVLIDISLNYDRQGNTLTRYRKSKHGHFNKLTLIIIHEGGLPHVPFYCCVCVFAFLRGRECSHTSV